MSSRTGTRGSTMTCSDDPIDTLKEWLDGTDTVIVGAGAGLSAAAGLEYNGRRFRDNFGDFIAKYGYRDMYSASFQRYESPEEHWAYWSRHIMMNRYLHEDNGVYADLLTLLHGKDYFVITTNVDHCFQRFGFDKERLYYTQGDYGLWQCSGPCCKKTYDNEETVRRMYSEQRDMCIPSDLVPYCPECGRPMMMNLRVDDRFVEDEGWHRAAERYSAFCRRASKKDVLFLELGVGYNTPGIIKYPFWEMSMYNPRARYARISIGSSQYPPSIKKRALGIDMDIGDVLRRLVGRDADRQR